MRDRFKARKWKSKGETEYTEMSSLNIRTRIIWEGGAFVRGGGGVELLIAYVLMFNDDIFPPPRLLNMELDLQSLFRHHVHN
jgi:hypothetical protein